MSTIADLWVKLGLKDKGFTDGLDRDEKKASRAGAVFKKAFLGISVGAGLAAVATGGALLKIGSDFDNMSDTIRIGTGATGTALKGLEGDALAVFKSIPTTMDLAGQAIADLNTRTGQTGTGLQNLARTELELARITGGDLASQIETTTRLFGDWGIATDQQVPTLDKLFRASQATGIGVDDLAGKMVQFGAPLRQMGFDFDTTAALLGKFEKEGVNTELVMGSLRIALGKMAKDGITDPRKAFALLVDEIKNAGDVGTATAKAIELFGARAGPDMAAAIREGRFEIGDLFDLVASGDETILGAAAATNDWRENLQILSNRIQVVLLPIANKLFGALNVVALGAIHAQEAFDEFRKLGIDPFTSAVNVLQGLLTRAFGAQRATSITGTILDARDKIVAAFDAIRDHWGDIKKAVLTAGTIVIKTVGFIVAHVDDLVKIFLVLSPIILPIILKMLYLKKVVPVIMNIRKAIIATRIAVLALNPWLLVLTAAVLLFALAYKRNWLGIRDITNRVVGWVVKQFLRLVAIFRGGKGLHGAIADLPKPLQKVAILVRRLVVLFGDLFHGRWGKVREDLDKIGHTLGNLFKSIGLNHFGDAIRETFRDVVRFVSDFVTLVGDIIHGRWGKIWGDLKDLAIDAFWLFIDRFKLFIALVRDIFDLIPWNKIKDAGISAVSWLWEGMKDLWTGTVSPWLKGLAVDAAAWALEKVQDLSDAGHDLIQKAYDGAKGLWDDTVLPWFGGLTGKIVGVLESAYTWLYNTGHYLFGGFWAGIQNVWNWIIGQLGYIASVIANPLSAAYNAMWSAGSYIFTGLYDGMKWVWDHTLGPFLSLVTAAIPVIKGPPEKDKKLLTPAGKMIIGGLMAGIEGEIPKLYATLGAVTNRIAGMGTRPGSLSLATRAVPPAAAMNTNGATVRAGTTNHFAAGAIVVYESQNAEATAKEILKRIRYVEAGIAS